jgi:hypothetical protein
MFLPLILVFGRYSLSVKFLGGLAIFTVKMWAVMWFIAAWLDEHLWVAMYPSAETLFHNVMHLELDTALKRSTLNTLLVGLYIGLPLVWSGMMGWIGMNVVTGIDAMKRNAIASGLAAGVSPCDDGLATISRVAGTRSPWIVAEEGTLTKRIMFNVLLTPSRSRKGQYKSCQTSQQA